MCTRRYPGLIVSTEIDLIDRNCGSLVCCVHRGTLSVSVSSRQRDRCSRGVKLFAVKIHGDCCHCRGKFSFRLRFREIVISAEKSCLQ